MSTVHQEPSKRLRILDQKIEHCCKLLLHTPALNTPSKKTIPLTTPSMIFTA